MKYIMDRKKHETIMSKILLDIYKNTDLRNQLVFKGGTACYFFYRLPRFSVDLDFDLLDPQKTEAVFEIIKNICSNYGVIKDAWIKHNTILIEISYGKFDRNLKIEISGRAGDNILYESRDFYGFLILVMTQAAMCANKLIALTQRKKMVNRDLFDAHFFLKNDWPIDADIIMKKTGKTVPAYLSETAKFVSALSKNYNVLFGLGELIDEKQKFWIKNNLIQDLSSLLQIYSKQYS